MAPIPRYWYVETVPYGEFLEVIPVDPLGPMPVSESATLFDPSTGEVYGEAVLMSALPWPRFCDFATGKEVILPHGAAVTLESAQAAIAPIYPKAVGDDLLYHGSHRGDHVRVEMRDGKVFASMFFHPEFSSQVSRRKRTAVGSRR